MGLNTWHPRQELLELVDQRLRPADRARVEQHLAGCAVCRADVAELMQVSDTLNAIPAALRGLTSPANGSWSAVWARVQGVPLRRMAPLLNLYVSLAVVVFVLAAALPAGLGHRPAHVTVGAIQTPVAAQVTPSVGPATASGAAQVSTALATGNLTTGAHAIPVPTPIPGMKG